jgi:hypothetical protein
MCNLKSYRTGRKEEELGKTLRENNIKNSVITESKKNKINKINCTVLKRLKIIRPFTVKLTDTPEASREI